MRNCESSKKKALINILINSHYHAFSNNSYSDTLSDFPSRSTTSTPDKYNQNIKSNKNNHNNANIPQCTHIHLEVSDITYKHPLNNKVTSNITKKGCPQYVNQ